MKAFSSRFPFLDLTILFTGLLAVALLPSCLQRAYLPIQSIPLFFTEKGDQSVDLQTNFNSLQLQYGKALSDSWGASLSGYVGFQGQRSMGASAVWYLPNLNKWDWEIHGGYRFVLNRSDIRGRTTGIPFSPALFYTSYYSQMARIRYHELPITQHLRYRTSGKRFWRGGGVSLQIAPIWFDHYHFWNKLEEGGCLSCISTTNHLLVQSIGAISISPSISLWFGSKHFPMSIKVGGSWSSPIGFARGRRGPQDPPTNQMFEHPELTPIFLQLGMGWNTGHGKRLGKK